MTLCEVLSSMATKLGLTEHELIILYLFNRTGVSKVGIVRALHIITRLAETHGLLDEADSPSYGEQLARLNILSDFEGSILSGTDEVIDMPSPQKKASHVKVKKQKRKHPRTVK